MVSKKAILKLALTLAVLAGSLGGARAVQAAGLCPDICCDLTCSSVRHCFRAGGSCLCENFCSTGFPGGID
jgi:hypothetical protein